MRVITILFIMGILVPSITAKAVTFQEDVDFLSNYVDVVVLESEDHMAQVAIVPAYQGRIMTSTASGPDGPSFGWVNRELIASQKIEAHINVFGGEDRFWMGPEGGQFAIFFPEDAPFDLEHWQTPACIDTEPFTLVSKTATEAVFSYVATVANCSGTTFKVKIDRTIRLDETNPFAEGEEANIKVVNFVSENTITNIGDEPWTKESGLLSIWILGMFNPTPDTTVVIPFRSGAVSELGAKVNDSYFGKVPEDKLVVKDDVLFFSGDGTCRSKIGIGPKRAGKFLGSYTPTQNALTVVRYNKPENVNDYVNSMWEIQEKPYGGDVVNSYNDGPPAPGKKALGPFYELETSSPAAALAPGKSITHTHRTSHIIADSNILEKIAKQYLGAGLDEINNALPK
ncbi:MAG: hypothetical protein KAH38_09525 [Candidatus Hydrogenedentes bacterium]|nr:hypothetical protein [Candidatus Hydrogenedentota bacterium]